MLLMAALVSVATAAANPCAPDALRPALEAAIKAEKDPAAAKTALAPAVACPVADSVTYIAHVLRASIAVSEGDWAMARQMLDHVGVHPEMPSSALAGAARLRADEGLGDAAAFTRDRDALIDANSAMLARLGKPIEAFRVGSARILAFRAPIRQGAFVRAMQFIVVPDDPAAYPQSVQVTDDVNVIAMQKEMAAKDHTPVPEHAWFVDRYSCGIHGTMHGASPTDASGELSYDAVKAMVVKDFADAKFAPIKWSGNQTCGGFMWILPGLGARLAANP